MPDHPSVLWRKRHVPRVVPRRCVNSILSVLEMVVLGLLAHPESRHLRRVGLVHAHLAQALRLP